MQKTTAIPVIDLHSDLLSFLTSKPGRMPEDPLSRNSFGQMRQGHVQLQTLAIFSPTDPNSVEIGRVQVETYQMLLSKYPIHVSPMTAPIHLQTSQVHIVPAFENGSGFAAETESMAHVLQRIESYRKTLGHIFYISLTWEQENRFGGGNQTRVGLKEDGKRLLEWMSEKKIAIDLSHTSDNLAHDLLNFIDQRHLPISVLASHSNFRTVSPYARNLSDEIAKEIIYRKGLIGLNFFAPLLHPTDPLALIRHVEFALSLGAKDALCFGADFFCDVDFPSLLHKYNISHAYHPLLSNSSAYPTALQLLAEGLHLSTQQLEKIAYQNALHFLTRQVP